MAAEEATSVPASLSAVVAACAAGTGAVSPSARFFSDSLMERRNSLMSTFGRMNCFGAGATGAADGISIEAGGDISRMIFSTTTGRSNDEVGSSGDEGNIFSILITGLVMGGCDGAEIALSVGRGVD